MNKITKNEKGFSAVEVIIIIIVIIIICGAGFLVYKHNNKKSLLATTTASTASSKSASKKNTVSAINTNPPTVSYTGWQTYHDTAAGASFFYPSNWTLTQIAGNCDTPGGCSAAEDKINAVELTSQDKNVSLEWSGISGVGGDCDNEPLSSQNPNGCSEETVFSVFPINNAMGLYVVEGAIQDKYKGSYAPFMAIQDSNGVLKTGQYGLFYESFKLPTTNNKTLFRMGGYPVNEFGTVSNEKTITFSTLSQAQNFFMSDDAQQAQDILLSLHT